MRLFVGTSGWNYEHWRGRLYPENLPQKGWLRFYSNFFNTVEINMTFYRFPVEKAIEKWKKSTPENFLFSVKGNRLITHLKKLKDTENILKRFLNLISVFEEKLGPVLFQLPSKFNFHRERLEDFCSFLSFQEVIKNCKFSIEIRDKRWMEEEAYLILKKHKIALCFSDYPEIEISSPLTSDFLYIRRHGPSSLYSSCYNENQIKKDANFVSEFSKKASDAFIYYNNDANGWAVLNAIQLKEELKIACKD
ncbi:MAG: DUF72 domain-containing protein [Candidatus Aminicenantia bacterium]